MKAHYLDRNENLSRETLAANGVLYEHIDPSPEAYRAPLDGLKSDRGYIEEDVIELSPSTPGLDAICAKFVDEHHHDEDEVRFVLQGEGIFDIRSLGDEWMRVLVERGDLIVVPKGRHHRFLLTDSKAIRCVRLFRDKAGWIPHYRA
jgi:1,2-dihydroxy-3-keto-5-methylthiopentene dioxygenase